MKRVGIVIVLVIWLVQFSHATTFYVDINGSDASGDGSTGKPWRTIKFALSKVAGNQGHTIKISTGTFIEQGPLKVPTMVSIEGSGSNTIIKAASSFYYQQTSGWRTDKILFQVVSTSATNGNQSLKNFSIDGDNRSLYGGIIINGRNNVLVDGLTIQNCGFVGLWLWNVKDSRVTNTKMRDCAWPGTGSYATAALCISGLERVEFDHLDIDEGYGAAVKAMGQEGLPMYYCKFHDNRFSTPPEGRWVGWNGTTTPAIVFELYKADLVGNELFNNYFDANVSLVMWGAQWSQPKGVSTIRIYNNIFDCITRAKGDQYGLELSIHDVEIYNNYFWGGKWGISDWEHRGDMVPYQNWKIHHNVFHEIKGSTPGIIRTEYKGLKNIEFYNNTIELTGQKEISIVQLIGGKSGDIKVRNNLIINNTTGPYAYYPPQFIRVVSPATITGLVATNNFLQNLPIGNISGTNANNLSGDPQINKSGNRPDPYYRPKAGSPLIDKGTNVGFPYSGSAPDIGAFEFGAAQTPPTNSPPSIGLSSPANNASFAEGSSITLSANAGDTDGTISKVEFFNGTTKLGEDASNPYTYTWNNAPAGTYSITAKATDNSGSTTTSTAISITVVASTNSSPAVSITSPGNSATFASGSAVTINANANDSDGTVTKVEFFSGTTKLGEDATSPYSYTWSNVQSGSHSITARATDNRNAVTNSSAISITVMANSLPTVSLTSPVNNASFSSPATIVLTANASDSDGSITKVEFFSGSTKLGEDVSAPYAYNLNNVAAGTYSITAKATDNNGGTKVSAISTISVAANLLPTVKITSPANNSNFVVESSLVITASASDPDGSISKVEFFNGLTKIGEDTTSPYSVTWNNLKEGTYTLTAKATDSEGAASSDLVTIFVNASGIAPIANAGEDVIIELPANSYTLQGYGEDSDGIIMNYTWQQAEGPDSATLTANSNNGELIVSDLIEGTYRFVLTVTDNGNLEDVDEVIIQVVPISLTHTQIPKVFTPNDDGINDTWNWSNTEVFQNCKLTIYNRFGQKIYESISYDNTWDGSISGSPLQEDAYYYIITCDSEDLTGAVRIVR